MTDYRDINTPNYNYENRHRATGGEKSPIAGILIALAVIAFVFLGLSMLGSSGTAPTDAGAPTVSEQTIAPAPATPAPQPSN